MRPGMVSLAISLSCLGLDLVLAASHPLAPGVAILLVSGMVLLCAWRPWHGITAVPALLPVLDFSPWTGWLIVGESDLFILAVLAGGHFHLWRSGRAARCGRGWAWVALVALALMARVLAGVHFDDLTPFAGHFLPLNGLRVGKSLLWIALLFPVAADSLRVLSPERCMHRYAFAALAGSAGVVLAVLWERAFHPGLFDISTPYRTVGPFWEMHHGGAALDAYFVLIAPLLVWAWRSTESAARRSVLGIFIVAFAYACLTTFSRGVVFATGGALLVQAALLRWLARGEETGYSRIRPSSVLVLLLVATEVALAFGSGSFMNLRLQDAGRDLGGRIEHWERGLRRLKTPFDWLFGSGLGTLPARLIEGEDGLALPGRAEVRGAHGLALSGPDRTGEAEDFGRYFALSQRFDAASGHTYRLSLIARSRKDSEILARVCAAHLLYPAYCDDAILRIDGGGWQVVEADLPGGPLDASPWRGVAHGVFLLSAVTPGTTVEIREAQLVAQGHNLLRNPRFDEREGGWFSQSFAYFLPWHIDNLYLELLMETGLVGLFGFVAGAGWATGRLFISIRRKETFSVVVLSSLAGVLVLGLVVSMLDMPRIAVLSGLFVVLGVWSCRENNE